MKEEYLNRGLDLKRLTLYFQKKIWIILLIAVIGAGLGGVIYQMIRSVHMPVQYNAVSKLYITFGADENGEIYQYYNGYTWNDLMDADPILNSIMKYLPNYQREDVKEGTSAEILSDIRLLTITVKGDNEKFVREVQAATEYGLVDYAKESEELRKIEVVRTGSPERIYWNDDTTKSCIAGALLFGILTLFIFAFVYVLDDAVYVQMDVEKRYPYKALGVMPANQKGLQPYVRELRSNIEYSLKEGRELFAIDMDNHAELRLADLNRLMNWEVGGTLDGDSKDYGELVWHVHEESDEEDEEFNEPQGEWTIHVINENDLDEQGCQDIRKQGGVLLLVPFGTNVSRRTERTLTFLKNQDCNIYGIIISEADEEYLNRYFS